MSHAWTEATGFNNSDSIGFYNHFLEENDKGRRVVQNSQLKLGADESASLMVIDMQNDFMLLPPGLASPPGRFSVGSGLGMGPKLAEFIKTNKNNFDSIVFTRDTHPIDHCSFFTMGGPFPPHCVMNHEGAALHPSMLEFKSLPNAHVVFKGSHSDADSFGASKYSEAAYLKKRQLGKCCPGGLCSESTGAFFLADKTKSWDTYPFSGVKQYPNSDDAVLKPQFFPDAKWENIQNQIGERFTLQHILPKTEKTGLHYIFIVGLAGDYCVKDTALNLSAEIAAAGKRDKVKVVVLQPYVRYACLPLQYVGGNQVYSDIVLTNIKSGVFSNTSKQKDIHNYIFKIGTQMTLLSAAQAKDAAKNIANIETANNSSNPNVFGAFLTPTEEIIRDYAKAGVQIAMQNPVIRKASRWNGRAWQAMGGARRNRTVRGGSNNKKFRTRKAKNRRYTMW